ncbi:MAG: PKD domain-containing protein [Bacteroidota bacterium]
MDTNNKYQAFEKMLQDKLANHEYSYNHNDWLDLEKDLPKGKSPLNFTNNLFRYLIISAVVIVPTILILYFSDVFDSDKKNNKTDSNSQSLINTNNSNNNVSDDINTFNSNQNNNFATDDNSGSDASTSGDDNNSNQTNDQTSNSGNDNSTNSDNKKDDYSVANTNDNFKTNNNKTLSGELISSDVVEGCAPLKVKFSPLISSESITYLWAFGDGKTSSKAAPSHVYAKAGAYSVTLTVKLSDNKTTKKVEYSQKINVKSAPAADFEYSIDTETDEYSFTDNSTDAFVWTWNFGDKISSNEKDPLHTYTQDGNYNIQLIVMNTAGCTDTMSEKIAVKLTELYYCPTGFTPNGDGMNDYFGPIGERMNPDGYQMQIFDQNGILVFETSDLTVQWDGKKYLTNTEAAQGLYFWKISMKDKNNNLKEATGYLTLMR